MRRKKLEGSGYESGETVVSLTPHFLLLPKSRLAQEFVFIWYPALIVSMDVNFVIMIYIYNYYNYNL